MCLERNPKNSPLEQATNDIICYKCVEVPYERWFKIRTWFLRKSKRLTEYQTYFTSDPIIIGETYIAIPIFNEDQLKIIESSSKRLVKGFIHSFRKKEDAIMFAKCPGHSYVDVVECVIPAGTYYFKGINSDGTDGYASTKIRYVKVIR